ncbi:MAG: TRAP transporter small permease subunit, partial [Desulfobacterales bacterium]
FSAIPAINEWLGNIISYFNIVVVVIVLWEIVARYVFIAPTIWASEAMVLLSGTMYVLAGGYAQLYKRHVRIDLVYNRLGTKAQAICDLVGYLFFCLYMYALVWHGWLYAYASILDWETTSTPWDPLIWPVKLAIPFGSLLIWLQMTLDVIQRLLTVFVTKEGAW